MKSFSMESLFNQHKTWKCFKRKQKFQNIRTKSFYFYEIFKIKKKSFYHYYQKKA